MTTLQALPLLRGADPAGARSRSRASRRSALQRACRATTNICTVDREGNACVLTTSLGLGSGDFLPGYDDHLNSMLGESDLLIGPLEPGRRMESMMSPTTAFDDDGLALVAGAAGETRLRPALAQVRDPASSTSNSGRRRRRPASPALDWARGPYRARVRGSRDRRAPRTRLRRAPVELAPPLFRRRQRCGSGGCGG